MHLYTFTLTDGTERDAWGDSPHEARVSLGLSLDDVVQCRMIC